MTELFKKINSMKYIDISIPLDKDAVGPNCFYAPLFEASPVVAGDFIGDTSKGGSVNFFNVKINPHGNGTHTECVGHIAKERIYINDVLKHSFFSAKLISVFPTRLENGDKVIMKNQIKEALEDYNNEEALIVRTLPNEEDKMRRVYSETNPPYIHHEAISFIVDFGIKHLLVDLPSVDREEDGGKLLAHKAFWNYPNTIDTEKTITELIYVPDELKDGSYFINIQLPPFNLDAAPSRVLVYW